MPTAVAGGGRCLFSAALAGRCTDAAAALLAASQARSSSSKSKNRRRAPARKGNARPDGDRRRGCPPSVRQQYEENPYPRWVQAGAAAATTLLCRPPARTDPDVLIAGCGTGLSANQFAQQRRRAHPRHRSEFRPASATPSAWPARSAFHNIEFAQCRHHQSGRDRPQF